MSFFFSDPRKRWRLVLDSRGHLWMIPAGQLDDWERAPEVDGRRIEYAFDFPVDRLSFSSPRLEDEAATPPKRNYKKRSPTKFGLLS